MQKIYIQIVLGYTTILNKKQEIARRYLISHRTLIDFNYLCRSELCVTKHLGVIVLHITDYRVLHESVASKGTTL